MSITIPQTTEQKIRTIAVYLHSRDYPKTGLTCIFDKFTKDKTTLEALAALASGKMINLHLEQKNPMASYVEILDDKGEPIKHQMIDDVKTSETFGVMHYEGQDKTCFEHLELLGWGDQSCPKCFEAYANRVCVKHDQSLAFCQKCRQDADKFRGMADILGHDKIINMILAEHKKQKAKEIQKWETE